MIEGNFRKTITDENIRTKNKINYQKNLLNETQINNAKDLTLSINKNMALSPVKTLEKTKTKKEFSAPIHGSFRKSYKIGCENNESFNIQNGEKTQSLPVDKNMKYYLVNIFN